MAKVKVGNLKKIKSQLRKEIIKGLRDKEVRREIGNFIAEGIKDNFNEPVTSKKTLAFRKYYERANTTDPKYNRLKINITFTGELLKDLMNNVKFKSTAGKASYEIGHSDKQHKLYKKPKGVKKRKKTKGKRERSTYKEIQGYIEKNGYDYLDISEDLGRELVKFIRRTVEKAVVKFNKL